MLLIVVISMQLLPTITILSSLTTAFGAKPHGFADTQRRKYDLWIYPLTHIDIQIKGFPFESYVHFFFFRYFIYSLFRMFSFWLCLILWTCSKLNFPLHALWFVVLHYYIHYNLKCDHYTSNPITQPYGIYPFSPFTYWSWPFNFASQTE